MMKLFKYIVISLVVLITTSSVSNAQSYSIIPNDSFEVTGYLEDLETLIISQLNTTSDTLNLKWQKVSASVPANWEASICDNFTCNLDLANNGTMNPVVPNDMGFLLLHITAHLNYGTAVIRYSVWDINYPASKDTLTFIMHVYAPSGTTVAENNSAFSIFPNPSNSNINLKSTLDTAYQYFICDLSGRLIFMGRSKEIIVNISTSNLANGIYNASLYSKNKFINTQRFTVQH